MTGIIDYAGIFPPAQLPLEPAIRNYARYCTEPESWMLGRFICPAAKLAELSPFVDELFATVPPLRISALGSGKPVDDFAAIADFRMRHGSIVSIDVFETKCAADPNNIAELTRKSHEHRLMPFLETAVDALPAIAGSLPAGFKLRCGGLEPSAFPDVEHVASVIESCDRHGVPMKLTAGLHHPTRRFDAGVKTKMHGFLNVFVAGVFANAGDGAVRRIVEDENPLNFRFDDDCMSWHDYRANIAEIEIARRERVISFGSCSFDEPRDDLYTLGLLKR